jgi:hypothetical protein
MKAFKEFIRTIKEDEEKKMPMVGSPRDSSAHWKCGACKNLNAPGARTCHVCGQAK